jgi:hypothetical protein
MDCCTSFIFCKEIGSVGGDPPRETVPYGVGWETQPYNRKIMKGLDYENFKNNIFMFDIYNLLFDFI